ncbi:hypothetical protein ACFLRB_01220 [Acidobacteriota bacterium]
MKKDNETEKRRGALQLTKTTVSNLSNVEMNGVVGGYGFHTDPCNDFRTELTSGLPSCPDSPN